MDKKKFFEEIPNALMQNYEFHYPRVLDDDLSPHAIAIKKFINNFPLPFVVAKVERLYNVEVNEK